MFSPTPTNIILFICGWAAGYIITRSLISASVRAWGSFSRWLVRRKQTRYERSQRHKGLAIRKHK